MLTDTDLTQQTIQICCVREKNLWKTKRFQYITGYSAALRRQKSEVRILEPRQQAPTVAWEEKPTQSDQEKSHGDKVYLFRAKNG